MTSVTHSKPRGAEGQFRSLDPARYNLLVELTLKFSPQEPVDPEAWKAAVFQAQREHIPPQRLFDAVDHFMFMQVLDCETADEAAYQRALSIRETLYTAEELRSDQPTPPKTGAAR